jgi:prepilin-type N-terminal cleavage/methylation domain-containing protein
MTRLSQTRRRTGFTLIELLVVVGILAILAALVTAGVGRMRGAQMVKTTEQSLTKMRMGLDQQWKAVLDQAREDARKPPSPQTIPVEVWAWCNNDRDRVTALWGYIQLRLAFPQTFAEARSPVVLAAPGYTTVAIPPKPTFNQLPNVAPTTLAEYRLQSAVLLYLIMSERGGRGMLFSSDDVTNGDWAVSGGTYRVFKDAWGQPICFERFTTSPDVNSPPYGKYTTTRVGFPTQDTVDPMWKLGDGLNWDASSNPPAPNPPTNRKTVAELAVMPPQPPGGPTAYTPGLAVFYTFNRDQTRMFAMISFGPDKNMDATPTSGDDLYSYRVHRQGNTSN